MSTITCPFCDLEVSRHTIDNHDGCCPECGAFISGASSFEDEYSEDYDEDYDEEYDDEFGDDLEGEFDDSLDDY